MVLNDVPPYSIQAGAPSREIKVRLVFQPPDELRADRQDLHPYFYRGFHQRLSELAESLKRGVIFAEDHAVVTLSKRSCSRLRIKGRLNVGVTSLRLRIRRNGETQSELTITEDSFDQEIRMEGKAQTVDCVVSAGAPPLRAFNCYTFDIVDVSAQASAVQCPIAPYGLSIIEQLS